nr:GMC oxidoreductase [Rhizobium sp. BK060]
MRSDLYFSVLDRTSWSYFGARVAAINTVLHKPFSRGRVMLERISGGLKVTPEFQFLSDERDGPRLFRALLLADALIQSTSVRPLVRQTGIVKMSNLIRRITKRSTANSIFDHVSGALLPRMPAVEAQIIRQILRTAPQDTGPSDIMLASQGLSNMVTGLFHPVGSCRMGARDDDAAVVTSDGLVRGLSGLCVCDASIMPSIPRANTNLPTMMIGERMSDIIKDMLRQQPA